jgi:hypothetical protein
MGGVGTTWKRQVEEKSREDVQGWEGIENENSLAGGEPVCYGSFRTKIIEPKFNGNSE